MKRSKVVIDCVNWPSFISATARSYRRFDVSREMRNQKIPVTSKRTSPPPVSPRTSGDFKISCSPGLTGRPMMPPSAGFCFGAFPGSGAASAKKSSSAACNASNSACDSVRTFPSYKGRSLIDFSTDSALPPDLRELCGS